MHPDVLFASGIPWTQFDGSGVAAEHKPLTALGVAFRTAPTTMGPVKVAILDDTCGNYIQLVEHVSEA